MRLGSLCAFVFISLFLPGCQQYLANPLAPHDIVDRVARLRENPVGSAISPDSTEQTPQQPFTFARAVALTKEHSPALQKARSEYETLLALAAVKTPLPNPSVQAGPQFGFGTDVIRRSVEPFGSIGFSIPTGKRLRRQDELNAISAGRGFIDAEIKQRELYLELRRLYSQLALRRIRLTTRKMVAESAQKSVAIGKRLVETGQATTLDAGLLKLDEGRIRVEILNAQNDIVQTMGSLSKLIGIDATYFEPLPEPALPDIPTTIPGIKELREILVNQNIELAGLRARYEVAEAELRLEIARQYPDFRFGPSGSGEISDRRSILGLTLGIDIPLFDRNQQAIASARARRDEIRIQYESAANNALASLTQAWQTYALAMEKVKLLNTVLVPQAKTNMDLVRKTLEAGNVDLLRVLESERAQRIVLIDSIESEISAREALIDIEQAIGYPIVLFPSEEKASIPDLDSQSRATLKP